MKRLAIALIAGTLTFAGFADAQGPGAGAGNQNGCAQCNCDKDAGGKCDNCGRAAGQGRRQGRGGMGMRGRMARGNEACMRMNRSSTTPRQTTSPKDDRK